MDIETQNLIADLEEKLKRVSDEWQLAKDNLLWPALIGPGMLRFGGNVAQLGLGGLDLVAVDSGDVLQTTPAGNRIEWYYDRLGVNETVLADIVADYNTPDVRTLPHLNLRAMWDSANANHDASVKLGAWDSVNNRWKSLFAVQSGTTGVTTGFAWGFDVSGSLVPGMLGDGIDVSNFSLQILDGGSYKEVLLAGEGGWNPTVTTQTSGYTAVDGDFIICNSTTAFTVTLPTPTANRRIVVKNINTGAVTVDGASTDTIDDQLSIILGMYDAVSLIADGTDWWIF